MLNEIEREKQKRELQEYYDGIAERHSELLAELSQLETDAADGFSEAYSAEIPQLCQDIEEVESMMSEVSAQLVALSTESDETDQSL